MLSVGQPPFPAEAVVKGNPMVITTATEASMAQEKAPDDGFYAFEDNVPHKVRKGDPIPEGATFYGDAGGVPPHVTIQPDAVKAATEEMVPAEAPKKASKRGPSETTDAEGPKETT